MDRGFRRGFTTAEKTELWDRWQRGESLKAIGRAFGKPSSSIYFQVSPHGGIRPSPRRRSRLALTLSEREEISRGIAVHRSARSMAGLLGRSPSTVSREISRNGGYNVLECLDRISNVFLLIRGEVKAPDHCMNFFYTGGGLSLPDRVDYAAMAARS